MCEKCVLREREERKWQERSPQKIITIVDNCNITTTELANQSLSGRILVLELAILDSLTDHSERLFEVSQIQIQLHAKLTVSPQTVRLLLFQYFGV